jgi:tetrachlorobenzoquinone reductase
MNMAVQYPPSGKLVDVMLSGETKIRVRLNAIRYAAREINLFEFCPVNDQPLPPVTAGAHIDIHLPDQQVRQYSLVLGGPKNTYVVGIKRDGQGRGGSVYIHDNLRVGAELEISGPRNNFQLREDANQTVLIAGGIGITPIWSMVQRLQELRKPWKLYFASRSPEDAAFIDELRQLGNATFHFDCENEGRPLAMESIVSTVPHTADLYCCGPSPMLEAFERATANRPAGRSHVEYFTPRQAAAEGGFKVILNRTGITIEVPPGSSILDALLNAGIDVPYSCTEGICGACQVGLIDGTPDHRDSVLTPEERAANNCIMVCCSGCKNETLTLDL